MVKKIHVFLGGSKTRPGMLFSDFGVSLGVHFGVQGVTFFPELISVIRVFFGSRPGGGPGPYFASNSLCFTRVIFRNSHFVREWSQSDPKKRRNRPPK